MSSIEQIPIHGHSVAQRLLFVCNLIGVMVCDLPAAEVLIERGAAGWRYLETPSALAENWQPETWSAAEFDDSTWPQGRAILGYGDPDIATQISYGAHPQRKESSVLFRRRFRLVGLGRFRLFRGRVCCDDGAVVYVNGREVFRCNLPSGSVTYSTRAVRAIGPGTDVERRYHQFAISNDAVAEGDNVVAVSVHQANATSSDLAMDLELAGLTSEEEVDELKEEVKRQAELNGQSLEASMQIAPIVRFQLGQE